MSLIRIVIMFVELSLLMFLMLMSFLTTAWIEHDTFAVMSSELDWWIVAGQRLMFTSMLSAIAAVLMWLINRYLFVWSRFDIERLPIISGVIVFAGLFCSALAGAIYFAIEKPSM